MDMMKNYTFLLSMQY